MTCASCFEPMTAVGKTWRCACGAAWVPEAAFVEMVAVMREGTVPIPWHERAGEPRPCPQCQASMRTVALADIPLDRCDSHGIWFDGDELQRVLTASGMEPLELTTKQKVLAGLGVAAYIALNVLPFVV